MSVGPTKSAVRNCACRQGMWAAAVMSVAEGVFLPQEVALPRDQQRPLLPLDPPLDPRGVRVLQVVKAQETAPEAEAHTAALKKISSPRALLSYILSYRGKELLKHDVMTRGASKQ